MEIKLTKGYKTIIDDSDYPLIQTYSWYSHVTPNGVYAISRNHGKTTRLHRLLTNCPTGLVVDHINHDSLDNRRINLRIVSTLENRHNNRVKERNKGIGMNGVSFDKIRNKWTAYIMAKNKQITLGRYQTVEEARTARINGEKKFWNEEE